jgi:chemotaxis protein methyltransferase CheR
VSSELDLSSYQRFRDFLEQQCGIVLGDNKQYLVKSRLTPLMAKFNIGSLTELVTKTLNPIERQLRAAVIDAMTTNETLWFRDEYPFRLLKDTIFPELGVRRQPLRIWSAASSSGQEPYSIAMTFLEYQQKAPTQFQRGAEIIGTDISQTMLEHCKDGCYDGLALQRGLSSERKKQFFEPAENGMYKVKDQIKALVKFRHLNLLNSYSLLGRFDIVFCRNVLIYFSVDNKKRILSQIRDVLNPNGILFLGASESLSGISQDFEMVRCNPGIYYRKK